MSGEAVDIEEDFLERQKHDFICIEDDIDEIEAKVQKLMDKDATTTEADAVKLEEEIDRLIKVEQEASEAAIEDVK